MKNRLLALLFGCCALVSAAADKLAVAEPAGSGVSPEELKVFWGMLEAKAGGGQYEVITRSALQAMLTEIGLSDSSGLVDPDSSQRAKIARLKGVQYILASSIGKFGSRLNVTLMVLDASTGSICPDRRITATVASPEELADRLDGLLRDIGIGPAVRGYGYSAVLAPVIRVNHAPAYLGEDMVVKLEEALLSRGVRLRNLKNAAPILSRNGIGSLAEADPAQFARVGELLRVDRLIQISVDRFALREEKRYIEVSRREAVRRRGDMNGQIRVIDASSGEVTAVVPFREKVDFDLLGGETADWTEEDYARCLIDRGMARACAGILAKLEKR